MVVLHLQHLYAKEVLPVIVVSHHDALFELIGRSLKNGEHATFGCHQNDPVLFRLHAHVRVQLIALTRGNLAI